jgi:hypothetical protein
LVVKPISSPILPGGGIPQMYRSAIVVFAALSLAASCLHAGTSSTTGFSTAPAELKLSQGGLLDMNRLSFKNTAGVSFQSGEFGGMSQYYLNTITYQASKPLVVRAQVGVENTMFGSSALRSSGGSGARFVIPYLGIRYQPRENLIIDISISHRPTDYGYYGGYRH